MLAGGLCLTNRVKNRRNRLRDPAEQARDQADKFRTHAELAAVFEAVRKFGVQIIPGLDAKLTREIQQGMGRWRNPKRPTVRFCRDNRWMRLAFFWNLRGHTSFQRGIITFIEGRARS